MSDYDRVQNYVVCLDIADVDASYSTATVYGLLKTELAKSDQETVPFDQMTDV